MPIPRGLRTRIILLIVACVLAACWLIPPFFHAGRYREILQSNLESRLGRSVELGSVTLRILPHPGFSIANVVIKEAPQFGSEPFARVGRVECDLRWRSLWGSRLDCSKIILSHPVLNAVRVHDGQWNVADFFHHDGAGTAAAPSGRRRTAPEPFDLEISDARINFTINAVKIPFVLDSVQAGFHFERGSVGFRVQGTPQRADLSAQPPGPFLLTGEWKPEEGFNGPFHARLTMRGSLLYGWLPLILNHAPRVYGLVNAGLDLKGSIRHVSIAGQAEIDQLHLFDSLPPSSPMPVRVTFDGEWDRDLRRLQIRKAEASFSSSQLRLTGTITRSQTGPHADLVLALDRSRLEDLVALANRLALHPAALRASGRVDGLLTLQGPWQERRYGGVLQVHSLTLRSHGAEFTSPLAKIRISDGAAHLIPAHFIAGPGVSGVATGSMELPAAASGGHNAQRPIGKFDYSRAKNAETVSLPRKRARRKSSGYELVLTLEKAPLHDCLRLARLLGVRNLRDLDATGWARATIRVSGQAWPFSHPRLAAQGDLVSARLLLAGLTEPVRFSRFHFELEDGTFTAAPVVARIGDATFTGWLSRSGAHDTVWRFDAQTSHLGMEQASLWFTVLGYQPPMPILGLIPGLRSLAGRSAASRNLFAAVNAQGSFECPEVTFHALNLKDFRAGVTLSGRVARVSDATFRVGGGRGNGSAVVDFKQAPARIAAKFGLSGLKLHKFAGRLPAALGGIRGALSAAGRLTTRGLTRPEMAAHLSGSVELRLRRVTFGAFDPLASTAHAAMLGSLAPEAAGPEILSLGTNLFIDHQNIRFGPAKLNLSGAKINLAGNYAFNGATSLTVYANMTHVRRRWINDSPQGRTLRPVASLKLTGPLRNLTVTPLVETARSQP
ncbi:MAG: AsmA family protein [Acidobacteriota bacterium]|nr:AsmA family protein [Acidobacteriota bacterium]